MTRGVHGNRQPTQPIRPAATRFDDSGGRTRVPTSLTWPQWVGCRFLISKPVKPTRTEVHSKSSHFSRFRPIFHLNLSIFGTINPGSGQTSDFSSWFAKILPDPTGSHRILDGSSKISPDLVRFRRISKHSVDNRVHLKPTTTRWQPKPTNPLLLWVDCELKNHPPDLVRVGCRLGKNPTRLTHGQPYPWPLHSKVIDNQWS